MGYLHLAHITNDSPLSCHQQWLKRQRSPTGAVRHQASKPSGLFPNHPLLPGHTAPPTSSAWENQASPLPRQRRPGAILLVPSLANLAHLVAGTEASDQRECSHEVFFFFLFALLDKSIISSLSSQVSRSSTRLRLPLPARPLPTRDPHTPGLGHCAPAQRPSGSSAGAPGPSSKWAAATRACVCSFCCFVFSANTRTEREARINSQTDTKQRDRETAV